MSEDQSNLIKVERGKRARPNMDNCVRRLPKVGQRVNLSTYKTYLTIHKLPKPQPRGDKILFDTPDKSDNPYKLELEQRVNSDGSSSSTASSLGKKKFKPFAPIKKFIRK